MSPSARPDPLWSAPGGGFQARHSALGLGIHVIASDEALLALLSNSFGRFAQAPESAPTITVDAMLAGTHGTVLPAASPSLRHRERAGLFTATDGASIIAADLPSGRAALFVDAGSHMKVVRRELLEAAVWRFATYQGMIAVHAATVVILGRSLVLRGRGGSGKSTLAYAAVRAGHTLVAEEVTWFDPGVDGSGRPALRGAPWRIHLEPSATELFSELGQRLGSATSQEKIVLDRDTVSEGWSAQECAAPGPIVFLETNDQGDRTDQSSWRALDPTEAESRFDTSAIVGEAAQPEGAYRAAGRHLIGLGAYALAAGLPETAVKALEAIARSAPSG